MTRSRRSVVQFIGAAVLVLALGACAQHPTASDAEPAQLRVQAATAGSAIATLVVTVTAPDIATPLAFNLPVQGGSASGTITIPAGSARLITLRAFDAARIETHHGSVTVDVVAGNNPTVTVILQPLAGNQPIVVQVGSVTILISPQTDTLSVGDTVRLRAAIIDARGDTVRASAGWATLTPAVVTVDTAGLATAVGTGSGQIVATYGGFGAAARIEVKGSMGVLTQPLAAGWQYTCGLTRSGAAYCWGNNDHGQLGDGSTTRTSTPVAVSGGLSFKAITAATTLTCGLTSTGAAYCWGGGFVDYSSIPVAVAGGLSFSALATGGTCGLTSAGAAYCWGSNYSSSIPVLVSGGLSFSALATGAEHSCGLTRSGAAYCWGNNSSGQLGDGSTTSSSIPVAVSGGLSFSALAAGGYYTCGLTSSGAAYCWGENYSSSIPVLVSGGLSFSALAAGMAHTCALTRSGVAYCWGENDDGQLGDGSNTWSWVPVAVSGGLTFSALATGEFHTCGLTGSGAAYCWGDNTYGGLGDGSTTNSSIPVAVSGGFGALAADVNHTRRASH